MKRFKGVPWCIRAVQGSYVAPFTIGGDYAIAEHYTCKT